jgi:hypothetical protein
MCGCSSETREGVGIAAKVVEAHDEDILGELEDVIRCVRVILGVGRGRVNLDFGYDCGFVRLSSWSRPSLTITGVAGALAVLMSSGSEEGCILFGTSRFVPPEKIMNELNELRRDRQCRKGSKDVQVST